MTKLERLSAEQEAIIPVVRDEWIKFCLGGNTEINREMAAKGLRWIYGLAKLDTPRIVFVNGPFAGQIAVWLIEELAKQKKLWASVRDSVSSSVWDSVWASVRDAVGDSVWDSVGASVGDSVWDSVWASVRDAVWASVRDAVGDSVWDSVGASVGDSVGDSVWASVRDAVGSSVRDAVRSSVWDSKKRFEDYGWCDLGGSAGWTAWMDYFQRIGIRIHDNFKPWMELMKSGVFMSVYLRGFAIVCPRPTKVYKDERGRLHNPNGPAAEWEGERYWFCHGTRVSEKLIMRPNELTAEEISEEKNSEVSRAIAEKLGWDVYMERIGTVLIDKWFDPSQLLHYELYDFKDRRFSLMPRLLKMESPEIHDGTRPHYIEPVDPGLKTCQAARKWQMRIAKCEKCDRSSLAEAPMWRHGDVQIILQTACPKCRSVLNVRWPTVKDCNRDPELVFAQEA